MTVTYIKRLMKNENRVLELKKTTGEHVKGMQSLCAFLNLDGKILCMCDTMEQ